LGDAAGDALKATKQLCFTYDADLLSTGRWEMGD
jgi:hypothetical protein